MHATTSKFAPLPNGWTGEELRNDPSWIMHWSEAEQMRMMNQKVRELGLPPENRKAIRKTMLQGLLKARDKSFTYRRIETPDAMKPSLREAAAAMKASIARQVDEGAVSVIGDLDALSSEP